LTQPQGRSCGIVVEAYLGARVALTAQCRLHRFAKSADDALPSKLVLVAKNVGRVVVNAAETRLLSPDRAVFISASQLISRRLEPGVSRTRSVMVMKHIAREAGSMDWDEACLGFVSQEYPYNSESIHVWLAALHACVESWNWP